MTEQSPYTKTKETECFPASARVKEKPATEEEKNAAKRLKGVDDMNTENIIHFKSIPPNYEKEKDGRKPNTLRTIQSYTGHLPSEVAEPTMIIIENSETGAFFTRQITDITRWEGWVIISWKHEG